MTKERHKTVRLVALNREPAHSALILTNLPLIMGMLENAGDLIDRTQPSCPLQAHQSFRG